MKHEMQEVRNIFQELQGYKDIRKNLISLREKIRNEEEKEALKGLLEEQGNLIAGFLGHEDPKARRNAALILGELGQGQYLTELAEAYKKEETLFVRADYLKAMQKMDFGECLPMLQKRLEEMEAWEIPEDSQKHYQEEIRQLERMLLASTERNSHIFCGMEQSFDLVLTTNRQHREVTARQIHGYPVTLLPLGVRVAGAQPESLFRIRTFREMLFGLSVKSLGPDPVECARTLASSDLIDILERGLGKLERCFFRISVIGEMALEKRGSFSKRCGFQLEQQTGRRLVNAPEGYEAELRLYQKKDGTFFPLLKFSGLRDPRFTYRKKSLSASMHPSSAALMAALSKPYLKEQAQVLDPFCGVGTMLIERDLAVPAGTMYGVDIFGEAIDGARENSRAAGKKIYYVHRDFLEFSHGYLFDEIFTDMPVRGKKSREEQEQLYSGFFARAARILAPGGVIIMYSNERGFINKHLRLRKEFRLYQEYTIQKKGDFAVYVIGKRGMRESWN